MKGFWSKIIFIAVVAMIFLALEDVPLPSLPASEELNLAEAFYGACGELRKTYNCTSSLSNVTVSYKYKEMETNISLLEACKQLGFGLDEETCVAACGCF